MADRSVSAQLQEFKVPESTDGPLMCSTVVARRRLALLGELAMRIVSDLVALICVTAFLTGVVIAAAKLLIQ